MKITKNKKKEKSFLLIHSLLEALQIRGLKNVKLMDITENKNASWQKPNYGQVDFPNILKCSINYG